MSAIVSVPVPVPYYHSPYQLSGGEGNSNPSPRDQCPKQVGSRATSPSRDHRWSPIPASSDRSAEQKQMTNHGSSAGPPPAKGHHWQSMNPAMSSFSDQSPSNPQSNERLMKVEDRTSHGVNLPPIYRSVEPHGTDAERRPSRSLGVHSILNPPSGEELNSQHRRRSFAKMEEDFRNHPSIASTLMGQPRKDEGNHEETSPPLAMGGQRAPRRILTPISPRIQSHRAASYGQGRRPTGTIDAQESPFLSPSARFHSQEVSPPPQPPAVHSHSIQPQPQQNQQHSLSRPASQQSSPFLMPAVPAPTPPPVGPSPRSSASVVHSARASSSPSNYSAYSQSGMSQGGLGAMSRRTSPSPHSYPMGSGPTPPGSHHLSPSPVNGPLSKAPPVSLEGDQQQAYNAMISSGQNYQVLTIDTTKGHMQMPVEVQTASRMADEKRKRNAGASARFRQRRKEKEREASTRISHLEQELAWAQEDSRFYKQERDFISDLLLRNFPQYKSYIDERPGSPIRTRDLTRRRLSTHDLSSRDDSASPRAMSGPAPVTAGSDRDRYEQIVPPPTMSTDRSDRTGEERPATRRRTETLQPVPSPALTNTGHRPYQPVSPSFPSLGGRPPAHLPGPHHQPQAYQPSQVRQDQHRQPLAQSQLPPIGHAPYRQDPSHEERSWPPRSEHPRQ